MELLVLLVIVSSLGLITVGLATCVVILELRSG